MYVYTFSIFLWFFQFLCISAFEHDHLEPWHYRNVILLLLSRPVEAGRNVAFVSEISLRNKFSFTIILVPEAMNNIFHNVFNIVSCEAQ